MRIDLLPFTDLPKQQRDWERPILRDSINAFLVIGIALSWVLQNPPEPRGRDDEGTAETTKLSVIVFSVPLEFFG